MVTDKQTGTDGQTDRNTLLPCRGGVKSVGLIKSTSKHPYDRSIAVVIDYGV